jgi:hypothetical protein
MSRHRVEGGGGRTGRAGRWRPLRTGAALSFVLGLVVVACGRREAAGPGATAGPVPDGKVAPAQVSLLFPAEDGFLHAESRQLPLPEEPGARLQAVVAALLAGPQGKGLVAPLPKGTTAGKVYLDPHGVAYVDLLAEGQAAPPPAGSDLELLRVYSLVDTVAGADPRVRAVVLLWNGTQRQTFSGHIDTVRPLVAETGLVR